MTGREWKPGDVALVTWSAMGKTRTDRRLRAINASGTPCWWGSEGTWIGDHTAKEVRPLVVISPEDREQVERLTKALVEAMHSQGLISAAATGVHPAVTAAALRSLITPPKPDEPQGLGAVVEDAEGKRWVRNEDRHPQCWYAPSEAATWDGIDAVKVLSEGVR